MVDRQGVVRWYHRGDSDRFIVDAQVAIDGQGVVHDQFHSQFAEDVSVIRRIAWDGSVTFEEPIPMGHRMFAQLPDGGFACHALDPREWVHPDTGDVQTLVGDAIVEISPDGVQTEAFNAWGWLDVQPNGLSSLPSNCPQGIDWTHGNALKSRQSDDSWLLSLGNAGTVMTIDRATGPPTRTVGAMARPSPTTAHPWSTSAEGHHVGRAHRHEHRRVVRDGGRRVIEERPRVDQLDRSARRRRAMVAQVPVDISRRGELGGARRAQVGHRLRVDLHIEVAGDERALVRAGQRALNRVVQHRLGEHLPACQHTHPLFLRLVVRPLPHLRPRRLPHLSRHPSHRPRRPLPPSRPHPRGRPRPPRTPDTASSPNPSACAPSPLSGHRRATNPRGGFADSPPWTPTLTHPMEVPEHPSGVDCAHTAAEDIASR